MSSSTGIAGDVGEPTSVTTGTVQHSLFAAWKGSPEVAVSWLINMCGGSVEVPFRGTDENKILITLDLRTAQKTNKLLSGAAQDGSSLSSVSKEVPKSKEESIGTAEPTFTLTVSWLIDAICNHRVPEKFHKYVA